jgi:hypothetical protein
MNWIFAATLGIGIAPLLMPPAALPSSKWFRSEGVDSMSDQKYVTYSLEASNPTDRDGGPRRPQLVLVCSNSKPISLSYDVDAVVDRRSSIVTYRYDGEAARDSSIHYDESQTTIHLPVTLLSGMLSHHFLRIRFTAVRNDFYTDTFEVVGMINPHFESDCGPIV